MKVRFSKNMYIIVSLAALLVIMLTWLSCTQKAPLDPTQSLQENFRLLSNIAATPSQLITGGNMSIIRVRLIDENGGPLSSEIITFSSTYGTITETGVTNSDGWAQATLVSGAEPGEALVTAYYGTNVSIQLTINILSPESSRLRIESAHDYILANGIDSTEITVTLAGDSAQPVVGALLYLLTDAGRIQSSVLTGSDGKAKAILTSAALKNDASATVTVSYDSSTAQVMVGYKGVTLDVSASPQTILTGGQNNSVITTLLKETTSNIAISNGSIVFSTDLGTIPNTSTTNNSGIASVELTSGSAVGTAHVVARYGETLTDTVDVGISTETTSLAVLKPLSASKSVILANGEEQTVISTSVVDISGNPLQGQIVNLSTTAGSIVSAIVTGSDGLVNATLTSSASRIDIQAVVTITLGTQTDTQQVLFEGVKTIYFAQPTSILANGQSSSTITYILKKTTNNEAVPDATINFGATLGTIPSEIQTDASGIASVTLVSSTATGTSEIVARYGKTLLDTVTVAFISEASATYTMGDISVSKAAILANGIDQSQVSTIILDAAGNPVAGETVIFTATAGSIETSATSNSIGLVNVYLTSSASRSDLTANITATYGTQVKAAQVAFDGLTVSVASQPAAIVADGKNTSIITYILKKTTANEAVPGATINFGATLGTIPSEQRTNSSGIASVTLVSGTIAGTSNIVARYGNTLLDSLNVVFIAESAPVYTMSDISVSHAALLANGVDRSLVTTRITDDTGDPVAGEIVVFSSTAGSIATSSTSDSEGLVQVYLTASAGRSDNIANITATFGIQVKTAQVTFEGLTVTMTPQPAAILADGQSTSRITYILKRTSTNEAVPNGTIRFGATHGTIPSQVSTNASGVAEATLISSASPVTSQITASYGQTLRDTTYIVFSNEAPTQYILQSVTAAETVLLANGEDQTNVSALVTDDSGNPASGIPVLFSANSGSIQSQANTNIAGLAVARLTAAVSVTNITSTAYAQLDVNTRDSVDVLFEGVTLSLSANPHSIIADGQSNSSIMAVLKRTATNVAVQGETINFGTDIGTIPNTAVTNVSGVAQVNLTSSTSVGLAIVSARYGQLPVDTLHVSFRESTPVYLQVTGTPPVLTADGISRSTIRAHVSDANHNPIPDGVYVNFSLDGTGTLDSNQQPIESGVATNHLTSGISPDSAWITISIGTLIDSIKIEYVVGEANQVIVNSDSTSLMADGQETAVITAKILDAQGTPIINATVNFSSNIGDVSPTAQTGSNGIATASFSSGEVGTAIITASVGIADGKSVTGQTTIILEPGGPNTIILNFDPTAIGVRETGQNQTAIIEAEVRDAKNNPVEDGVLVTFSIVHGPDGGEILTPSTPIPTVGGVARVSISSGTVSGNVRVQALTTGASGNVIAKASEILIHAGPPYMADRNDYVTTHLTIAAEQLNIWRTLGTTPVSIAVFDRYHNPVQEGTAVYITTSGGGVTTHTAYTDAYGKAEVLLTGANPQPTISNYFYGELVQDPNNASIVLPGPVQFPGLGNEWLLPNFDGDFTANYPGTTNGTINNTMPLDSISASPRYGQADALYVNLENDGLARIVAYTEGHDAAGTSIRAWDEITVVYSGAVNYSDDALTSMAGQDLGLSDPPITVTFSLIDDKGNPIEAGSDIKLSLTNEVDAKLSWSEITTSDGWGTGYYQVTISNAVDPAKPAEAKTGNTAIQVEWIGEHQYGTAVTSSYVNITNI